MTTRTYKLAARPIHRGNGRPNQREIVEFDGGHRLAVVVVVADADAMDVRDALERAYAGGREDRSGEIRDYLTAEIARLEPIASMEDPEADEMAAGAASGAQEACEATLVKMTELKEQR